MEIKADLEKKKTDFHAVVSILLVLKKKISDIRFIEEHKNWENCLKYDYHYLNFPVRRWRANQKS